MFHLSHEKRHIPSGTTGAAAYRSLSLAFTLAALVMLGNDEVAAAILSWSANTESNLAGYNVYHCGQLPCSKAAGTATLLATLGKVTSFNIGTPAVVQYYVVTAYKSPFIESGESNVATYLPAGAATPPTVSLGVAAAPNLPFHGTTTQVTVAFNGPTPAKVELSRDGMAPFATWPSGTFFTLSPDGHSLTGNWCITSSCWGNVAGPHVLHVLATYSTGATATAEVTLNVAD